MRLVVEREISVWKSLSFVQVFVKESTHKEIDFGDNCIQNFHLGRYTVGFTVGNLVVRRRASGVVKSDSRPYIRRYTSQMKILGMVIPIPMHLRKFV